MRLIRMDLSWTVLGVLVIRDCIRYFYGALEDLGNPTQLMISYLFWVVVFKFWVQTYMVVKVGICVFSYSCICCNHILLNWCEL